MKEKEAAKKRCGEFGMVFRFLFWFTVILVAAYCLAGVWTAFRPASDFTISLTDTPSGIYGVSEFTGVKSGLLSEIMIKKLEFDPGILSDGARQMPKAVFVTGYFCKMAANIIFTAIFWFLRQIFRNIEKYETPFVKANSRAILGMGITVIVLCYVQENLLPLIAFIQKFGASGFTLIDLGYLSPGIPFLCLSYMFEYGRILQQESDETL